MQTLSPEAVKEVHQLTIDLDKAISGLHHAGLTVLAFASEAGAKTATVQIEEPSSDFKLGEGILVNARQVRLPNVDQDGQLVVANHRDFQNISVVWVAESKPIKTSLH